VSKLKSKRQLVSRHGRPLFADKLDTAKLDAKSSAGSGAYYGGSWNWWETATQTNNQVSRPWYLLETRHFMTEGARSIMMGLSRWMFWNTMLGGIIIERARDVVGNAWDLESYSKDTAWARAVQDAFAAHMPMVDVRRLAHWRDFLQMAIVARHVDGDAIWLAAKSEEGLPCIQGIPSNRVGASYDPDTIGGIITNYYGRPLRVRVTVDDWTDTSFTPQQNTVDVPAESICFVIDRQHYDQLRGMPAIARGGRDLHNIHDIKEFTEDSFKLAASIGMIKSLPGGQMGRGPFKADGGATAPQIVNANGTVTTIPMVSMIGGQIVNLPEGWDLQQFDNKQPAERYEPFVNSMLRFALTGMGFQFEYSFNSSEMKGPGMRFVMEKADTAIAEDQRDLEIGAKWYFAYWLHNQPDAALWKKAPVDWERIGWSKPPQKSIDIGRQASADQTDYRLNLKTKRRHLSERNENYDAHMAVTRAELFDKLTLAKDASDTLGIPIEIALRYIEDRAISTPKGAAPAIPEEDL
jgi:hypothetical protein